MIWTLKLSPLEEKFLSMTGQTGNLLIEQIVDKVFPKGTMLVWKAEEVPIEERFWVIGGTKGPRWVIPQIQQYGLSVLRQWQPYGASSHFKWRSLLVAYAFRQLHRFPSIISIGISGASSSNWQHLGGNADQTFIPIIYIGTPGATRKAVVSLIDSQRQIVVGVAKIPLEKPATVNILREAEILTCLASAKPDLAPKILFVNQVQGIAVQTAVPGKLVGKYLTKAHIEWLTRLCINGQETSLQEKAAILRERIGHLLDTDQNTKALLERLLKDIDDPTAYPSTWIHGDFAPWNLKWMENQTLAAIDWEEAEPNGLPLYDLLHYHYIQSYLLKRKPNIQQEIWRNPLLTQYFHSLNIDYAKYENLTLFYLADLWLRSTENSKWDDAAFFLTEISHILR
jgi:Phosphotransferase enzyme family